MTMVILRPLLLLVALLTCLEFRHILAVDVLVVETSEKSDESSASCTVDYTCQADNNGTCQPEVAANVSSINSQCRVWLAMSTLPGAGIGMFAGAAFKKGEDMMRAGDHIIPIVDLFMYHGGRALDNHFFLWDEYTWNGKSLQCDMLGITEVHVASPGFGAAANSFMDFINVDEGNPSLSVLVPQNIHRSKDPGAGAFTYYHSRMTEASRAIEPGQELFVEYGNDWFKSREKELGPIPVEGDHEKASNLYKKYKQRLMKGKDQKKIEILEEMWDTFVVNSAWNSRVFAAFPPKEDYEQIEHIGLTNLKRNRMVRSAEWLQQHGMCADNLHMDVSTIPQAGHGAFASRPLAKGAPILPIPLIHIPDRKILDMYDFEKGKRPAPKVDKSKGAIGKQLLLNYCLGHADSTLLLSPYGPVFSMVNHNQTLANVRLQWALPARSNHHPEMLEKPVHHFESERGSRVAMELIALRDIQSGEEIFLDYGDEWEEAWQEHVRSWAPVPGAEHYVSAEQLNKETDRLKTEFEQIKDPYPVNVNLKFDQAFIEYKTSWKFFMQTGGNLQEWKENIDGRNVDCEITRYTEVNNGQLLYTGGLSYTAVILDKDDRRESSRLVVEDMPREAFIFEDRPYSSDMFLTNAFRHDIRIPDDNFPDAWKNLS